MTNFSQLQEIKQQLAAAIRERDEARAVIGKMELAIQHHEKLADNALSDWREADSRTVRALHERNEAREQRDRLAEALEKTAKDFILFRDVARENGIVGTLGLESLYLAESALASLNQATQ